MMDNIQNCGYPDAVLQMNGHFETDGDNFLSENPRNNERCVVTGMELVGPRARVIGGAVISCFYSAGMVLLAAVAMWVKNWRILQAIYAPGLICFLYYW
jgi:hypothetical protein